jgi:flotillin
MESMVVLLVLIAIAAVALLATGILVKRMLYICQPNEVLVFSGTQRRVGSRRVGYVAIKGGRKLKLPLLEVVDRIDLTNMAVGLEVRGVLPRGGDAFEIKGVANIKVAGDEPLLGRALERLLGKRREAIMAIARETLEGDLRGVLARLGEGPLDGSALNTVEQRLIEEADYDLNRFGLVLDTVKLQNVAVSVKPRGAFR